MVDKDRWKLGQKSSGNVPLSASRRQLDVQSQKYTNGSKIGVKDMKVKVEFVTTAGLSLKPDKVSREGAITFLPYPILPRLLDLFPENSSTMHIYRYPKGSPSLQGRLQQC